MSVPVSIASVFSLTNGLVIARLHADRCLEYASNINAWTAQWNRVRLPLKKIHGVCQKTTQVSLAVDCDNVVIATVMYENGDLVIAKLNHAKPAWYSVQLPDWS